MEDRGYKISLSVIYTLYAMGLICFVIALCLAMVQ